MAETSSIEWTDATINFWWGCTAVGPGCDGCYAEAWAYRTGHRVFGQGMPRRKIKNAEMECYKLHDKADVFEQRNGRPRRVFMSSMCDIFDNEVPDAWRNQALITAERCFRLEIQMLTKRISNVPKLVPDSWKRKWPRHIGLMVTVVNQEEADRDIPRIIRLKKEYGIPWIGLSVEPLLGPIDLTPYLKDLDWVIVGGETGHHARPMHPAWACSVRDQCAEFGVAFFFKQWGEYSLGPVFRRKVKTVVLGASGRVFDNTQHALEEHLRTGVLEDLAVMRRLGKKHTGRRLDGRIHEEYPKVRIAA